MAILDLQLLFVEGHRGPSAQNICQSNLQTFQNTPQDVMEDCHPCLDGQVK